MVCILVFTATLQLYPATQHQHDFKSCPRKDGEMLALERVKADNCELAQERVCPITFSMARDVRRA